jgi:hypothetical protein
MRIMTAERPPALALWLLRRFAASKWNDALTGDLIEEYRRRRSPWWCWRQVLSAIAGNT